MNIYTKLVKACEFSEKASAASLGSADYESIGDLVLTRVADDEPIYLSADYITCDTGHYLRIIPEGTLQILMTDSISDDNEGWGNFTDLASEREILSELEKIVELNTDQDNSDQVTSL